LTATLQRRCWLSGLWAKLAKREENEERNSQTYDRLAVPQFH
jgi:hypothetical protein